MIKILGKALIFLLLLAGREQAFAQAAPGTIANGPARDTSMNKSNTGKWKYEDPALTYEKLNSARICYPDTSLHNFQRAPFTQPWYRDLGNLGSPVNNLLFTPEDRVGPSLGYHIFDVYRFNVDSLNYYNTKRAYSIFNYQLGSKLEQTAGIMHSQNIRPNWNIAVEYHKTNSPGFYKTQRNNNDNACLTSNYKSLNKRYQLFAGMVYNKEQHDENGGIVNDSDLTDQRFDDRKTINSAYQNSYYSNTRSPVTNVHREFTFLLQHSYKWGRTDTTFNSDSTQYTYTLIPRFSITHKLEVSTEKHTYKDLSPDSLRYITLFNRSFNTGSTGYIAGSDSVYMQQKWFWLDNRFMLNGFIGKPGRQLSFSAGFGTRYDQFISRPDTNLSKDKSSITGNYLVAEVKKESLGQGEWEYGATTRFFITGNDAGNFLLNALIGKQLKNNTGSFVAGFGEQLNSAPYSYANYENPYAKLITSFNKESATTLYATLESPRLRFSGGYRNHVLNNYIYINEQEVAAQYSGTFSISQLWARKVFKVGNMYLDNELVFQLVPGNAPVNIPPLMGRHQLSFEKALFRRRLKLATGVEVRYNTPYTPAGYDALLNKFFFSTGSKVANTPEMALFLNFRIKRFRAFIMGDNLQQLFSRNTILYTGTPVVKYSYNTTYTPVYASPDALIRFGFNWVLVN